MELVEVFGYKMETQYMSILENISKDKNMALVSIIQKIIIKSLKENGKMEP